MNTANPCVRCGKQRVTSEVWTEMIGKALVTHTQTICPDSACQKIVEEEIAARREKRELFINKRSLFSLRSNKRSLRPKA